MVGIFQRIICVQCDTKLSKISVLNRSNEYGFSTVKRELMPLVLDKSQVHTFKCDPELTEIIVLNRLNGMKGIQIYYCQQLGAVLMVDFLKIIHGRQILSLILMRRFSLSFLMNKYKNFIGLQYVISFQGSAGKTSTYSLQDSAQNTLSQSVVAAALTRLSQQKVGL